MRQQPHTAGSLRTDVERRRIDAGRGVLRIASWKPGWSVRNVRIYRRENRHPEPLTAREKATIPATQAHQNSFSWPFSTWTGGLRRAHRRRNREAGGPIGIAIDGLRELESDPNLAVFHAGTKRSADGGFETAGGRVLGVTARGGDVAQAAARAYAAVDRIRFRGMQLRRDIAALVLST